MTDLRREFTFTEDDRLYLDAQSFSWEAVQDGTTRWILLQDFPIVAGYNISVSTAAMEIPQSYPDTQIDMVYFHPHLVRLDGRPIPKLKDRSFDGKIWQRWSRHRTAANPWRSDYDSIETHLLLVDEWLSREFRNGA